MNSKKYIFGLGNPESKYTGTRHNIGFEILDRIRADSDSIFSTNNSSKLKSIIYNNSSLALIYPQTYMNLSGEAVRAVIDYYKSSPDNILIVYDDVSLPLGRIRWTNTGGAGGHHGIESIFQHLKTRKFARLRFGVGPDPGGDRRADFVLSRFPPSQASLLEKSLKLACESIQDYLKNTSMQDLMNKYNGIDLNSLQDHE